MSVFLTEYHHILTATLNSEITSLADGIKDSNLFLINSILTWLCHFAHHGIMEVTETYSHSWVFDETCIEE